MLQLPNPLYRSRCAYPIPGVPAETLSLPLEVVTDNRSDEVEEYHVHQNHKRREKRHRQHATALPRISITLDGIPPSTIIHYWAPIIGRCNSE